MKTYVSLNGVHRSSRSLLLREDVSSLLVERRVNTSESGFGTLDLDHVDRLLQSRRSEKSGSVDDSSTSRDKLRERIESSEIAFDENEDEGD